MAAPVGSAPLGLCLPSRALFSAAELWSLCFYFFLSVIEVSFKSHPFDWPWLSLREFVRKGPRMEVLCDYEHWHPNPWVKLHAQGHPPTLITPSHSCSISQLPAVSFRTWKKVWAAERTLVWVRYPCMFVPTWRHVWTSCCVAIFSLDCWRGLPGNEDIVFWLNRSTRSHSPSWLMFPGTFPHGMMTSQGWWASLGSLEWRWYSLFVSCVLVSPSIKGKQW